MRARILIGCFAAAAVTPTALSQISYTSSERFVDVTATLGGGDNAYDAVEETGTPRADAVGFSDFNSNITFTRTGLVDVGGDLLPEGFASASGGQTSALRSDRISASGFAQSNDGPPAGSSQAFSQSVLRVTFELSESSGYLLNFSATDNWLGTFSLVGPETVFNLPNGFGVPDPTNDILNPTLNQSGVLSAGVYQLELTIFPDLFSTPTYDFDLIIPTPATAVLLGLGGLVATRRRR